jgi:hypothetical protein
MPDSPIVSMQFWRRTIEDLPSAPKRGDVLIAHNMVNKRNTAKHGDAWQPSGYKDSRNGKDNCWIRVRLDPSDNVSIVKDPRFKGELHPDELDYATRLAKWAKVDLADEYENPESRNHRMLVTLDKIQASLFFDCVVEVLSVPAPNVIYVTDYTGNHGFDAGLDGFMLPENMRQGHSTEETEQFGGKVLKVVLYDSQVSLSNSYFEFEKMNRQSGKPCLMHMRNVRCRIHEIHGEFLEATLGNSKGPDKGMDYAFIQPELEVAHGLMQ